MASKRDLKRNVNNIFGELFIECWVQYKRASEENKEKVQELFQKILEARMSFISRISHPEPGNISGSYKQLRAEFKKQLDTFVEEIGKLA